MASTYTSLHYHIIFSTKNREPTIADDWRADFHAYIAGTIRGLGAFVTEVGGVNDHVHLLVELKSKHCVADFLRELKTCTSKWVHTERRIQGFAWQEGYAAFTVSPTSRDGIKRYILNQEEHHRHKTFMEELIEFLNGAGIEYDPKYLE